MLGSPNPSPRWGLLVLGLGLGLSGCFDPEVVDDPTLTATVTDTATATATTTATTGSVEPETDTDVATTNVEMTTTATTTGVDSGSSDGPDPDTGSDSTGGGVNTIYEIQDGTVAEGEDVDVREVVVTAVAPPLGVFVQESAGGMNSGVFVVTGGPPMVSRGDEVDVVGTVLELNNQTVIDAAAGSITPTGNTGIELMPEQIPIADLAPAVYEPWEGVLVRVQGAPLTVTAQAGAGFTVETVGNMVNVASLIYDVSADPMAFPAFGVTAEFTGIQGPLADGPMGHGIAPRDAMDLDGYDPPLAPDPHQFPTAGDTSMITSGTLPWNGGDYFQGVRMTMLPEINSVDVHIDVESNGLTACGFQNAEVTLNGVLAGDFTIEQGTVAIDETFMLPMPVMGPNITVRYETTMTVASGCGAAGYSLATSTITFNPT